VNLTGSTDKKIVPIGYPAVNGTPPVTYAQVLGLLAKEGSASFYNTTEQVPTMWTAPDADGISQWVGYDNADSIVAKLKAAKKRHIGGAMIWSLDQDELKGLPLLTAVSQQILGR
jgi:GH18 family chitinase